MRTKKGLSETIKLVLIIFSAIILAGTAGFSITKIIKEQTAGLSPQMTCIEMQLKNIIKIEKACYNSYNKELELTLTRSFDSEIENLEFAVNANGLINRYSCINCNNCAILDKGKTTTYYFSFENKPDDVSVFVDSCFIEKSNLAECLI